MKKTSALMLILILCLTAIIFLYVETNKTIKHAEVKQKSFVFGKIKADRVRNIIEFPATVVRDSGHVDFLLYLKGYKWLGKSCAIVSREKLGDLQDAIAFLDWKIWDEIWTEKRNKKIEIFVKWKSIQKDADVLVSIEDEKLGVRDFIFLGSPYFDSFVLNDKGPVNCEQCPIYELEERTLREDFIRDSGRSGYELNRKNMPPAGEDVIIVLKL